MCKIMGNPPGWRGKPSQILQETFGFGEVPAISTIQTHGGIQLCVNKLLLQPPPQKTQLDCQQDCSWITRIRPGIQRLRQDLEFHFILHFPAVISVPGSLLCCCCCSQVRAGLGADQMWLLLIRKWLKQLRQRARNAQLPQQPES